MKRLIRWISLGSFLYGVSLSVWAAEEKNSIRFIFRNATAKHVQANCGNFSYPGGYEAIGRERAFTIGSAGLIWNPRKLQYTCSIFVPYSSSGGSIAVFYPDAFDHSKPDSVVILTIHSYEKRACVTAFSDSQVLLTYSLSVDGRPIKDKVSKCFYYIPD